MRPWRRAPGGGPELSVALASLVDGCGAQILVAAVGQPNHSFDVAAVWWDDVAGVRDFWEDPCASAGDLGAIRERMRSYGAVPVEVEPGYLRTALREAERLSARNGSLVPDGYTHWKRQVFDSAVGRRRLQPLTARIGNMDARLLEKSADLLASEGFDDWLLPPEALLSEVSRLRRALRDPGGFQGHLEAAITEAIRREATPAWADRLRRRLQRQALLLHELDRPEDARRALAAAGALNPGLRLPPESHPFLRAMALRSLQRAFGSPILSRAY